MTGSTAADRWVLTLYIAGGSSRSMHAVETVRRLCDERLGGQADLEIVDILQQPARAGRDDILVAPTLVKRAPGRLCRIVVGGLLDVGRLCRGLGLKPAEVSDGHPDRGE